MHRSCFLKLGHVVCLRVNVRECVPCTGVFARGRAHNAGCTHIIVAKLSLSLLAKRKDDNMRSSIFILFREFVVTYIKRDCLESLRDDEDNARFRESKLVVSSFLFF